MTGANRGIGEAIVDALVAAGVRKVYAAARTLSALLTTPLTAAQIVGGKLSSRVVQLIILALMALFGSYILLQRG